MIILANVHSFPYMMCMHNAPVNTEGIGISTAISTGINFIRPCARHQRQRYGIVGNRRLGSLQPDRSGRKSGGIKTLERFEDISNQN